MTRPQPQFLLPGSSPPNCGGSLQPDECSPPPVLATPPPYYSLLPPPSPSSEASHGRSPFVTALIVAGSVLGFLTLCLTAFFFVRRMRQQRRRREALLEAAALAPAVPPGGPAEEVVPHHAWHIRTFGLDEAAIESIALTRYRAPGGGGAASDDCTVCLGEFQDGELLRLLPQCAHAFHVQCIDTWLRAHVSCPLCRATVMVMHPSAAAAAAEQRDDAAPPAAGYDDDDGQEQDVRTPEHEHEQPVHQRAVELAQIEQGDQESTSPERPHRRHAVPRERNFRRVASMDSPSLMVSAGVEAREDGQAGGAKQGTGDAVCCEVSPGSDHLNRAAMKRSLSAGSRWALLSRQCRARTSLLPL